MPEQNKKRENVMAKEPKANGRPLTVIDWDEFEKLCGMLCTQVEIADWFGCTDDTIQAAVLKKYGVGFSELYKKKSVKGKVSIRRAQYLSATEDRNPTMLIWTGKQHLGQKDKQDLNLTSADGSMSPQPGIDTSKLSTEALAEIMALHDDQDS